MRINGLTKGIGDIKQTWQPRSGVGKRGDITHRCASAVCGRGSNVLIYFVFMIFLCVFEWLEECEFMVGAVIFDASLVQHSLKAHHRPV